MVSLLRALLRTILGRPPRLICSARVWNQGVDELQRRAGGRRESGAFLLGRDLGTVRRIEQFMFYDDVDPNCFVHGIVEFDGSRFGAVWKKCRECKQTVLADVHVILPLWPEPQRSAQPNDRRSRTYRSNRP